MICALEPRQLWPNRDPAVPRNQPAANPYKIGTAAVDTNNKAELAVAAVSGLRSHDCERTCRSTHKHAGGQRTQFG